MRQHSLPEAVVGISLGYYEASRRGEFDKVDSTLEQLIGKQPKSMYDVLTEIYQQS